MSDAVRDFRPEEALEAAAAHAEELRDALQRADAWARDQAARHPLATIGVAMAAGYLVGRLLSRSGA